MKEEERSPCSLFGFVFEGLVDPFMLLPSFDDVSFLAYWSLMRMQT